MEKPAMEGAKDALIQALKQQLIAKDAELKAKDMELEAKTAEIIALEKMLSLPGIMRFPGRSGLSWNAIAAHGNILSQILAFLCTPTFAKLWTLARSTHVDLERSWCKTLNLRSVGNQQLHSSKQFVDLLAQPRWRCARSFSLPQAWSSSSSITIALTREMKRHLPELQDMDLLAYAGTRWTSSDSRRRAFVDAWRDQLRTLKLQIFRYDDELAMLAQLVNLQVLHIKLPGWLSIDEHSENRPRDGLLQPLRSLPKLEELKLLGLRTSQGPLRCLLDPNIDDDLNEFLRSCKRMRALEIVPFVKLRESVLALLSRHRLESLALYVSSFMCTEQLKAFHGSALRKLRLVRQTWCDGEMPLLPLPLSNRSGARIKVTLDILKKPSEEILA